MVRPLGKSRMGNLPDHRVRVRSSALHARIHSEPAVCPGSHSDDKDRYRVGREHRFWMDDLPLSAVGTRWQNRLGPKQITDAYLLALAIQHRGKLVTFDRRILQLAPEGSVERDALEILK